MSPAMADSASMADVRRLVRFPARLCVPMERRRPEGLAGVRIAQMCSSVPSCIAYLNLVNQQQRSTYSARHAKLKSPWLRCQSSSYSVKGSMNFLSTLGNGVPSQLANMISFSSQ